jgi:hypothetical protein
LAKTPDEKEVKKLPNKPDDANISNNAKKLAAVTFEANESSKKKHKRAAQ